MIQSKQLDFTGQTIYCGIDVHKKSWSINLRLKDMDLKRFSQKPSALELANHLKSNYPGADYRVVYEAGFCGFSYQRTLAEEGINCIIVHPADVPTTEKDKKRKCDTVDCRKLSKTLSENNLEGIYIPGVQQEEDRGVIRVYQQMVKDQTRCKNRIISWLDFRGITAGLDQPNQYWSKNFVQWLKELPLSASSRASLNILIQAYEQTRQMVLITTREMRILSGQDRYREDIRLLRTIPGIGPITALLLITEIGDIKRFETLDALCEYVGLSPQMHSTGDKKHTKGLTHRGNRHLREKIIEASWVAIRHDPALTMAYNEYCKRMIGNKAIIRIARKLLSRIRFVMRNKTDYTLGIVE